MTESAKRMVTVYAMGPFGLKRHYGQFKRCWEAPYAQYPAVPYCEIVPQGKRKPVVHSGNGFHTYIVVIDGSGPEVGAHMEPCGTSPWGTTVTTSRYSSFAPEWTVEADKLIEAIYATAVHVLMDCRHTIPIEQWRRYDANGRRVTRFVDCAPDFCQAIRELAEEHGRTVEFVYGLWRDYAYQCECGDQSPVLFEFVQWNREQLTNPVASSV